MFLTRLRLVFMRISDLNQLTLLVVAGILCPVDDSARFTSEVRDWAGKYIKDADKEIIAHLKKNGRLIQNSQVTRSLELADRLLDS